MQTPTSTLKSHVDTERNRSTSSSTSTIATRPLRVVRPTTRCRASTATRECSSTTSPPSSRSTQHTECSPSGDVHALGNYDVICGRHKLAFNNIGNRRFRVMVATALPKYMKAPTRHDKTGVVQQLVHLVQEVGGRFLTWNTISKSWIELGEKRAREKTGHAFRDMAGQHQKNLSRSSTVVSNVEPMFSQAPMTTGSVQLLTDPQEIPSLEPGAGSFSSSSLSSSSFSIVHHDQAPDIPVSLDELVPPSVSSCTLDDEVHLNPIMPIAPVELYDDPLLLLGTKEHREDEELSLFLGSMAFLDDEVAGDSRGEVYMASR